MEVEDDSPGGLQAVLNLLARHQDFDGLLLECSAASAGVTSHDQTSVTSHLKTSLTSLDQTSDLASKSSSSAQSENLECLVEALETKCRQTGGQMSVVSASVLGSRLNRTLRTAGGPQGPLLGPFTRAELCAMIDMCKRLLIHCGFSQKVFTKTLNKDITLSIEVVWRLHSSGLVPLSQYIASNLNRAPAISSLAHCLAELCSPFKTASEENSGAQRGVSLGEGPPIEPGTDPQLLKNLGGVGNNAKLRGQIVFDLMTCLVEIGYSDAGRVVAGGNEDLNIGLRKVATALLDNITRKVFAAMDGRDVSPFEGPVSRLNAEALAKYCRRQLALVLTLDTARKASDGIRHQQRWTFAATAPYLRAAFQQLLTPLSALDAASLLRHTLQQREVDWRALLSLVSVLLVCCTAAQPLINELVDDLLRESLGCGGASPSSDGLVSALLLARQVCAEGPPGAYQLWLQGLFSAESGIVASSRKACARFLQFLSDIVPYEPAEYLKVCVLRPPQFIPAKCRPPWSDYIDLARTRLADLKESIIDETIYSAGPSSSKASSSALLQAQQQVLADVETALSSFERSGKVPSSVMEASIFKKPYFVGKFLPTLLQPRHLPEVSDVRMRLIEALRLANKVPESLYCEYEKLCKQESVQLLQGVFDDESGAGEEMMLSLDDALQTALDSFRDAVIQLYGRRRASCSGNSAAESGLGAQVQAVLARICEALNKEDLRGEIEAPFVKLVIDIDGSFADNQAAVMIAHKLLNCICQTTYALTQLHPTTSDLTPLAFDPAPLTQLLAALRHRHLSVVLRALCVLASRLIPGIDARHCPGLAALAFHWSNFSETSRDVFIVGRKICDVGKISSVMGNHWCHGDEASERIEIFPPATNSKMANVSENDRISDRQKILADGKSLALSLSSFLIYCLPYSSTAAMLRSLRFAVALVSYAKLIRGREAVNRSQLENSLMEDNLNEKSSAMENMEVEVNSAAKENRKQKKAENFIIPLGIRRTISYLGPRLFPELRCTGMMIPDRDPLLSHLISLIPNSLSLDSMSFCDWLACESMFVVDDESNCAELTRYYNWVVYSGHHLIADCNVSRMRLVERVGDRQKSVESDANQLDLDNTHNQRLQSVRGSNLDSGDQISKRFELDLYCAEIMNTILDMDTGRQSAGGVKAGWRTRREVDEGGVLGGECRHGSGVKRPRTHMPGVRHLLLALLQTLLSQEGPATPLSEDPRSNGWVWRVFDTRLNLPPGSADTSLHIEAETQAFFALIPALPPSIVLLAPPTSGQGPPNDVSPALWSLSRLVEAINGSGRNYAKHDTVSLSFELTAHILKALHIAADLSRTDFPPEAAVTQNIDACPLLATSAVVHFASLSFSRSIISYCDVTDQGPSRGGQTSEKTASDFLDTLTKPEEILTGNCTRKSRSKFHNQAAAHALRESRGSEIRNGNAVYGEFWRRIAEVVKGYGASSCAMQCPAWLMGVAAFVRVREHRYRVIDVKTLPILTSLISDRFTVFSAEAVVFCRCLVHEYASSWLKGLPCEWTAGLIVQLWEACPKLVPSTYPLELDNVELHKEANFSRSGISDDKCRTGPIADSLSCDVETESMKVVNAQMRLITDDATLGLVPAACLRVFLCCVASADSTLFAHNGECLEAALVWYNACVRDYESSVCCTATRAQTILKRKPDGDADKAEKYRGEQEGVLTPATSSDGDAYEGSVAEQILNVLLLSNASEGLSRVVSMTTREELTKVDVGLIESTDLSLRVQMYRKLGLNRPS